MDNVMRILPVVMSFLSATISLALTWLVKKREKEYFINMVLTLQKEQQQLEITRRRTSEYFKEFWKSEEKSINGKETASKHERKPYQKENDDSDSVTA